MSTQTIPIGSGDSVEIRQVGGDLTLQGWDRNELQARGDQLRSERQEASIAVACSGDLDGSVARGVKLSISTVGGDVRLENLAGSIELGVIGGDVELRNLSGAIRVTGPLGGDIQMENVANISMGHSGKGAEFDIGERIRRTVQQATRRAETRLRRAEVKLRQYDGGSWKYNSGPDFTSPAQPGEPVSEEERMTILRMLQEKKITSEQAEKLLSALEGNA